MSDERIRALEREAAAGDEVAKARLPAERCRVEGHTALDGALFWKVEGTGTGRVLDAWHVCERCRAEVSFDFGASQEAEIGRLYTRVAAPSRDPLWLGGFSGNVGQGTIARIDPPRARPKKRRRPKGWKRR